MTPLSQADSYKFLQRRPTTKTGRGVGKRRKKSAKQHTGGFKLIRNFKHFSYETANPYDPEQHADKP